MIVIPDSDDELLAECEVDTFCAGGKGGQHANRTETAVRLTHIPTGVIVVSRKERSQFLNKMDALERLRKRLHALNVVKKKRVATKMPRSVRAKILHNKQHRSTTKSLRRKPSADE